MPELPEVQTTVNHVARQIRGRRISDAWMDPVKTINTGSNAPWAAIRDHLRGKTVASVTRRAKLIVINLDDASQLWVHQKMTGHLLVGSWNKKSGQWVSSVPGPLADDPMNRYIRMLITFDDGGQLALSDARRFARVILTRASDDIRDIKEFSRLGPEPLELTPKKFISLFAGKRGLVKPVLMDPSFIVGIGNIYADEILHRAGIHPFRPTQDLSVQDLSGIHRAMRSILTTAIRHGGSSTDDYRTPDGTRGGYQDRHLAYHRTGRACTLCTDGVIERTVRNGRSCHFCPNHQR